MWDTNQVTSCLGPKFISSEILIPSSVEWGQEDMGRIDTVDTTLPGKIPQGVPYMVSSPRLV